MEEIIKSVKKEGRYKIDKWLDDEDIILTTKIQVEDFATKNNILDQTFTSSISYRVQDQFSETVTLENKSLENLINKTYEEILIKLSQNINWKWLLKATKF